MMTVSVIVVGAVASALIDRAIGVHIHSWPVEIVHKLVYMLFGYAIYMASRG